MNGPLTTETLRVGYEMGAFPMADERGEISWYVPFYRALFPLSGIHVSRSMNKILRSGRFQITFNRCFEQVMRSCLRPKDNWISEEMIAVYSLAHFQGWAHSCEVWEGTELVGGTYGLQVGLCFSAESMFHRVSNASKVAVWAMVEECRRCDYELFDAQIMNPHLASLGAFEVPQDTFRAQVWNTLQDSPKPIGAGLSANG